MDESISKAVTDTSGWLGKQVDKAHIEMEKYNMPISDFIELKAAKEQVVAITAQVEALRGQLEVIANIAHYGGLIGFGNIYDAMTAMRRITIQYCPKHETAKNQ